MPAMTATQTFYITERNGHLSAEWSLDQVVYQAKYHGAALLEVFQADDHGAAQRYVDQRTRERARQVKPVTKQGLKDRAEVAERELAELRQANAELRSYVLSEKFTAEGPLAGYVSTQDVLNRLAS